MDNASLPSDCMAETPVFSIAGLSDELVISAARTVAAAMPASVFAGIVKSGEQDGSWHFDDLGNGRDYEPWPRTHTSPEGQQHFDMRSGAVTGGDVKPINQVDLLSAGSLGMGVDSEYFEGFLRKAVKAKESTEEEQEEIELLDDAGACEGIIGLREGWQGLEIAFVDVKSYAVRSGKNRDLAVVLPREYEGRPITGIAANAFPRRLVQGAGVRLLVVPDTVTRIGANAFSCLSVQHVHLGAGVEVIDAQQCDLSLTSPVRSSFCYSADQANTVYTCEGGSLFAKQGRSLVFLAAPYEDAVHLPDGIETIEREALAQGCARPSDVHFPDSLRDIRSKQWDGALWVGNPGQALWNQMAGRGIRYVAPDSVRVGDCSYDFDDEGALLVMGPGAPESASRRFAAAVAQKARSDAAAGQERGESGNAAQAASAGAPGRHDANVLALPAEVEGRPLRWIAPYALQYAPPTLSIPAGVVRIGHTNPARGVRNLVLPEGLETIGAKCFCSRTLQVPVDIPASVTSIGHGSFEYSICRFAANGAIVHVLADPLCSCFVGERDDGSMDDPVPGIPVDFAKYDKLILEGKNFPDRMGAVLHRLACPVPCSDAVKSGLLSMLEADAAAVLERVARDGDLDVVRALDAAGFLQGQRRFDMLEQLRAHNRIECVMHLMGTAAQGPAMSAQERFSL